MALLELYSNSLYFFEKIWKFISIKILRDKFFCDNKINYSKI